MSNQPSNIFDNKLILLTAFALGNAGLLMIYLLPLLVGVVAEGYDLNEQQTGIFASSDLIGYSIASISAFFWIRKVNWKYAALLGIAIMLLGNFLSNAMPDFVSLTAMRVFTGLGQGIAVAITLAVVTDSTKVDKNFAIYLIISLLFGAICVGFLPSWIEQLNSPHPIYYAQIIFAAIAIPLVLWAMPTKGLDYEDSLGSGSLSYIVLLALGGIFLMFIGYGALWSMAERIGDFSGLSAEFIGTALAISLIVAIIALLIPIFTETKFGRLIPIMASLICLVIFGILLFWDTSETAFLIAVCIGSFGINLVLPYISGLIGEQDATGKGVIMVTPMYSIGFALGPAIMSLFISENNYAPMGYVAAVLFLICMLIYWWIIKQQSVISTHNS